MDSTSGTNRHSSNKLRIGATAEPNCETHSLTSSRHRRLAVGENSDEVAIERNGSLDRRKTHFPRSSGSRLFLSALVSLITDPDAVNTQPHSEHPCRETSWSRPI